MRSWTVLPISLTADGAYNNGSLLAPLKELGIPLVSRLRSDAVLCRQPPRRRVKRAGRPRKYGRRLPSLAKMRRAPRVWRTIEVNIYRKVVKLEVKVITAWWRKAGCQLKVVLTRDPRRTRSGANLSTTDLSLTPEEIIETFARRWTIEQLFSDAKQALGLDSAEVRKANSVIRHAALAFGLVTVVRVWAHEVLTRRKNPPVSFAQQLSEVRELTVAETIFRSQADKQGSKRNARSLAGLFSAKVPA